MQIKTVSTTCPTRRLTEYKAFAIVVSEQISIILIDSGGKYPMTNEVLEQKIQLVMDKLIHLGGADYDSDKNISVEEATTTGNIARDFGIEEWTGRRVSVCTDCACCRLTIRMVVSTSSCRTGSAATSTVDFRPRTSIPRLLS